MNSSLRKPKLAGVPADAATGTFCGRCGTPDDGGSGPASDPHLPCREQLVLEPPRYCAACRRRMKVQVTPAGWIAECSRHGVLVR
ncbi:biotin synthase auxiliary protein BsaP [Arthrobacter sp. MMS24-T111]